ncbi:MAG: YbhB/YbcL family Raf kinase inhibitor-like protein [Planctomycetota bacterium]|jgi:Raf kinase inhibitor-like YbhB/YbcL family protein
MNLTSRSFEHESRMPAEFAFAKPDPETHATFAGNRNPQLSWNEVPGDCCSLVLICVDVDAPTVPDDVNVEGRTVPEDLPRGDFYHWAMVDIPPSCGGLEAGECSNAVVERGKEAPEGPEGTRQGVNDYCGWFAADENMAGTYRGYDGPAPPWNDAREHRYHFRLLATDFDRCPVEGDFTAAEVLAAVEGHVLAEATLTGTYTQNPELL